jgi:hypothetical protein
VQLDADCKVVVRMVGHGHNLPITRMKQGSSKQVSSRIGKCECGSRQGDSMISVSTIGLLHRQGWSRWWSGSMYPYVLVSMLEVLVLCYG